MKKNKDTDTNGTTDDTEILSRLGERVEKAVATIQELRRERDQLRTRVEELEAANEEHERFAKERGEIRGRIESILESLEALDSD
ncbi:MAG TPA: cell division protein ZapB [Thermoanaerobaculia bacterium]|nr:cell division protein ZapB [Thermoanaerobaculia bacterium]